MSIITTATRMWLTKSIKPFEFTDGFDKELKYDSEQNIGLYVHIPFCKQICDFCPYCKEIYDVEKCNDYIDNLIQEIHMVGKNHNGKKKVTSLYFGGGSPALAVDRIEEIINTIKLYFDITDGVGIELHPFDLELSKLNKLKIAGITKISIGVQSFNEKYQKLLGRNKIDGKEIKTILEKVKFETVSMDFIFALPNQTFEDLKSDIDIAFECGGNHIAIYPFIDFTFTKSKIKTMNKKEKRKLLDAITNYCYSKGYRRDSIWTFSNNETAKYSSMTRDNFLGFGCSATTLLNKQFKINTFSVEEYIKRIKKDTLPTSLTIKFTLRQRMVYYLFWTAYSTKVNSAEFEKFFNVPLNKMYGFELLLAKILGFVTEKEGVYSMTLKGAFYYHYYENFYTLSYIDKMWGIMREQPFPVNIKF
ncbi:MAG: radical SAM protein [Clostridia bacterium]|nr:radical SAM protein [Clostridia bacterium]